MYMGVYLSLLNPIITLPSVVITEGVASITDQQLQHPKAEKKRFHCVHIYMQFTLVRMMYCAAFATFFLLGVASAQSNLQLTACVNKEQNLEMFCKFTPDSDPKLPKNCYYTTENKVVGSTNSTQVPDSTFKNRANVSIEENTCKLLLKGFSDDKPKSYSCFIKQRVEQSAAHIVDKSKLQTCSAWCVMQHSGVALLLAFLTLPLLSELL